MKQEDINKIKDLVATCITIQELFENELLQLSKLKLTLSTDMQNVMNILKKEEQKQCSL
jgi:CO dehydrogenase/acetyl-CoA synthase beta subunit